MEEEGDDVAVPSSKAAQEIEVLPLPKEKVSEAKFLPGEVSNSSQVAFGHCRVDAWQRWDVTSTPSACVDNTHHTLDSQLQKRNFSALEKVPIDPLIDQQDREEDTRNKIDQERDFLTPRIQGLEVVLYFVFQQENRGLFFTDAFVSFLESIFTLLFTSNGLNFFLGPGPLTNLEQNTISFF